MSGHYASTADRIADRLWMGLLTVGLLWLLWPGPVFTAPDNTPTPTTPTEQALYGPFPAAVDTDPNPDPMWRFWAAQLALQRERPPEKGAVLGTALASGEEQSVGMIAPPKRTEPQAVPQPWRPADECSRLTRPVSAQAMRWCPDVARYLHEYGDWDEGDLTLLMRILDCESRGDPEARNPRSSATGLFQHLARYWPQRGAKAAAVFGFDNPLILMPYDNIAVGVWLYETGGAGHWPNCGTR